MVVYGNINMYRKFERPFEVKNALIWKFVQQSDNCTMLMKLSGLIKNEWNYFVDVSFLEKTL